MCSIGLDLGWHFPYLFTAPSGRRYNRMYFEDRNLDTMDFIRDAYKDDLQLLGGVLAEECAKLYYKPDDDPPPEEQTNL